MQSPSQNGRVWRKELLFSRAHSYRRIRGRSYQPAGGFRGTPSLLDAGNLDELRSAVNSALMKVQRYSASLAFKLVFGFHARMNDRSLERQQDHAGVEALACFKGDLDPTFSRSRCNLAIGRNERLAS